MDAQRSLGRRSGWFRWMAVLAGIALCSGVGPVSAQESSWRTLAPLPTPRRLLAAAAEGGKIYTFGGCGSPCFDPVLHPSTLEETLLEVYDPAHNVWSGRRSLPAILFGAAAAAPGNRRIYVFGGFVTGNTALEYAPKTDAWTPLTPLPTPRHGLAAVALNGDIYVVGGSNGSAPSNALEVYRPADGSWSRRAPMPTARVFLGAAAVDGKIYAIGGSPDCCGNGRTDAVEIYDPSTDSWSRGAPLPVALQVSAVAAANGKIYVFGGFIPGSGTQGGTFEYDPKHDVWISKQDPLPVARDQAPAVAMPDGIHVLGGSVDCHCRALGDHHTYAPADLSLTKVNDLEAVCPGQRIAYTITASNAGLAAVTGATLKDAPRSLRNVTWTCLASGGAACANEEGRGAIAERVDLPSGGTVTYTLSGTLDPSLEPVSGTLSNTATLTLANGVQYEASETNPIVPCASIAKEDGLDRVAPGDAPVYRITVRNHASLALPVLVTDRLTASGLVDVKWCCDTSGKACTPSTPGNLRTSLTLPPNGTAQCRATGTVPDIVPANCRISNTACVTPPGPQAGCASDIDVIEPPDLTLAILAGAPESCEHPFTIVVTNRGASTARDVRLRLRLENFALLAISGPCEGSLCRFPEIAPGAEARVTASLEVQGHACPAVARITAAVESLCGSTPITATSEAPVACDLSITKTDGRMTASPGDPILYTIAVENQGCLPIAGARVTDDFPEELVGVKWCGGEAEPEDCEPKGCDPADPCDLEDLVDLPVDGKEIYRASGTIDNPVLTDKLINTASVQPPVGERKTATDETRIVPLAPAACAAVSCEAIAGIAVEGGLIIKTVAIRNCGTEVLEDSPGPELEDVLPPQLSLVSATASSGTVTTAANTVTWDGSISPGETVTLEITAMIAAGTLGSTICNEATLAFEGDGAGDDQAACCFSVLPEPPIPVLSDLGLSVLALLLALLALARLRASG